MTDVRGKETEEEASDRKRSDRLHKKDVRANRTEEDASGRKRSDRKSSDRSDKKDEREQQKSMIPTIDEVITKFKKEIKQQPVFICTSCHRLPYKKGVQGFKRQNYDNIDKEVVKQVHSSPKETQL